jgi:hypothetical protein
MQFKIHSPKILAIVLLWFTALCFAVVIDRLASAFPPPDPSPVVAQRVQKSPETIDYPPLGSSAAQFPAPTKPIKTEITTFQTPNSVRAASPQEKLRSRSVSAGETPNSTLTSAAPAAPTLTQPPYEISWADPSNYGERYARDIYGNLVSNSPIIVFHETVGSVDSALNTFQTPHPNEDDQVSYHTLIRLNGTVVYVVPPEKRAFGAGNSVFNGSNGPEAVKTHRLYPPSVNNFAYHISLETPPDGRNDAYSHSGYTEAQYRSLAWLVAQSTVPDERITTHRAIDRSGERIDPRSFDMNKFLNLLRQYRETQQNQQNQ